MLGVCIPAAFHFAAEASGDSATASVEVLQGTVGRSPGTDTNLLFKTASGKSFRLLRTPPAEALFLDTNLYTKVLLLKGREKGTNFEVTANLRSVSVGRTNELYYYCSVCSIKSSIPGPCQCCREPVVLVEEPEEK
jgi:hypothetical protein